MVGKDPPKHGGKWWVFAALDHTLPKRHFSNVLESRNSIRPVPLGPEFRPTPCQETVRKIRFVSDLRQSDAVLQSVPYHGESRQDLPAFSLDPKSLFT